MYGRLLWETNPKAIITFGLAAQDTIIQFTLSQAEKINYPNPTTHGVIISYLTQPVVSSRKLYCNRIWFMLLCNRAKKIFYVPRVFHPSMASELIQKKKQESKCFSSPFNGGFYSPV